MNEFNFNSRETYLAFRSEWKKEYNALSNEIRALKAKYLEETRVDTGCHSQYALFRKRKEATNMLFLLAEAKPEAARQWAANREGVAA